MTQDRAKVTYRVSGTPDGVASQLAALDRSGDLVHRSRGYQEPSGRVIVNVTVWAQAEQQQRGLDVPRVVWAVLGSLPFLGAGGWVTGMYFADLIAQVLIALGSAGAAAFLLYAVMTRVSRVLHHCPGHHCEKCPNR